MLTTIHTKKFKLKTQYVLILHTSDVNKSSDLFISYYMHRGWGGGR